MKIDTKHFVIATKAFPMEFEDNEFEGNFTNDIEQAGFHSNLASAEHSLSKYDMPEDFQILPVTITFEI